MYGLCLLSNYILFLVLVPLLAHWDVFRTYLLPRLAYFVNLSKAPTDQYILAVGIVTFFVYFVLNLTLDLIQTIQSLCTSCQQRKVSTRAMTTNTPTSIILKKTTTTQSVITNNPPTTITSQVTSPCNVSVGLTRAHQQAVHYYPAFVASTFLIWSNTNKFDTYSIAFVMIQVFFLLVLPLSYMCPHPIINHINRIGYQCALLWTLAYAIYPRDMGYLMEWASNSLYTFCSPAPTDIYYTPIL